MSDHSTWLYRHAVRELEDEFSEYIQGRGVRAALAKHRDKLLEQFKLMQTTMQKTMKRNKKMGKGGMDLHNMDAATVAQMMHKMNPQMLHHLGGQAGLESMMAEMEKEEKKLVKKK